MTNEDEIHETEEMIAIDRINGLNRIKKDLRIDVQKLVMFDELVAALYKLDAHEDYCGLFDRAQKLQRGELI